MIAIGPMCLFVLLLLVPFIAGVAAFVVMRRGGTRPVTEPSCGACRSPVGGGDGLECPRCGADLREVGLITPRSQRRITPGMAVLIWTAIVPLPAFVLLGAATIAGPRQYQYNSSGTFVPAQGLGVVRTVTVDAAGRRIEWPWSAKPRNTPHEHATVAVQFGGGGQASLAIDHRDGTYRYAVPGRGEKMGRGPVKQQNVLQWWRDSGVIAAGQAAPPDAMVRLAADVAALAQASATQSPQATPLAPLTTLQSAGGGSGSSMGPVIWVPIGAILLCAAAWIGGCIVFARRCRR